jgi:uncharacterized protein (TIGR03083 family)
MTEAYELRVMVEAEQAEFADVLRSLTPDQWDAPSLCAGWSVHDVVLHIAWRSHTTNNERLLQFLRFAWTEVTHRRIAVTELLDASSEARFHDPDRTRSKDELIDWLASPATLSGRFDILTHLSEFLIHQQDVRRALGVTRTITGDRLALVLDHNVTGPGRALVGPGKRGKGLRLVATDITWFAGVGREVRGPGEAILMALWGRGEALDDLSGDGVLELRSR